MRRQSSTVTATANKLILVIDDSLDSRALLRALFEAKGFKVRAYASKSIAASVA